jgi:hypothetical protein
MMSSRLRALAAFASSLLLVIAFQTGATWGNDYAPRFGAFAPSQGELAFRLAQILYVLPAALLLAFAAGWAFPGRIRAPFEGLARSRAAWAWLLAGVAFGAVAVVRVYVLEGTEVTDDENVYAFQGWLLRHGALYARSIPPPFRAFFDNQFIVNDGRWYGLYFIGHSAVLALADSLGAGRWLGPLSAGVLVLLTWAIGVRVFDRRVALVASILVAVSPFTAFLFATRLSQPTDAVALALAVYAVLRVEERPERTRWWALGALAASLAVLTRPQTAVPFLLALLVPTLVGVARGRIRPGFLAPVVGAALALGGAALFLTVNLLQNGSPWRTGYQAYMAQGIPWLTPVGFGHSVRQVAEGLGHLNFWLFGWPASLAFIPFFERRPFAVRLAACSTLVVLSYGIAAVPTVAPVGPVYYGELQIGRAHV